jgi:putative transposase
MHLQDGKLSLSNSKGNASLVLEWPWDLPQTVFIRWQGEQYEAVTTYQVEAKGAPTGDKTADVDLGEIHQVVA